MPVLYPVSFDLGTFEFQSGLWNINAGDCGDDKFVLAQHIQSPEINASPGFNIRRNLWVFICYTAISRLCSANGKYWPDADTGSHYVFYP